MKTLLEKTKYVIDDPEVNWTKKISVMNTYHKLMRLANNEWTFADTARDLKCSRAFVSENVALAKFIIDFPESIHLSRTQALRAMRNHRYGTK